MNKCEVTGCDSLVADEATMRRCEQHAGDLEALKVVETAPVPRRSPSTTDAADESPSEVSSTYELATALDAERSEPAEESPSEVAVIAMPARAMTPAGFRILIGLTLLASSWKLQSLLAWLCLGAMLMYFGSKLLRGGKPHAIKVEGGRLRATSHSHGLMVDQEVDLDIGEVLYANYAGANLLIESKESSIQLSLLPYGLDARAVAGRVNKFLALGASGLRPFPDEVEAQRSRFSLPSTQQTLHATGLPGIGAASSIELRPDGMRVGRKGSMRSVAWEEITAAHVGHAAVNLELANGEWLQIKSKGRDLNKLAELLAQRWYDEAGKGHGTAMVVEERARRAMAERAAGLLPKKKKKKRRKKKTTTEPGGNAPPGTDEPSTPA